jgi:hypothetical protein
VAKRLIQRGLPAHHFLRQRRGIAEDRARKGESRFAKRFRFGTFFASSLLSLGVDQRHRHSLLTFAEVAPREVRRHDVGEWILTVSNW